MSPVRLDHLAPGDGGGGVIWSAPPGELNVNLVVLEPGGEVAPHVNHEVDVLVVVLDGDGEIEVDGSVDAVAPTAAVVVSRGATRRIAAGPHGIRYLTTHRARGSLTIGGPRPPAPGPS